MGTTGYIPRWYDEFETCLDGMLDALGVERSLREPPAHVLQPPDSNDWSRGTFIEQLGALAAWYTAQPGLHYLSAGDRQRGDPTPASAVRYSEWLELQPRYREACRRAVDRCADPQAREYLRRRTTGFSEIVSIGRDPAG